MGKKTQTAPPPAKKSKPQALIQVQLKPGAIVLLAILFVFFYARHQVIKTLLISSVKHATGLEMSIEGLYAGLVSSHLEADNLRLFNPADFPERLMLSIPDLYVDYDPVSFFKGSTHFTHIRVHLKELIVIKNQTGRLNLQALKVESPHRQTDDNQSPKQIHIDRLTLKVEKVIYKDYSSGAPVPSVQEFPVRIEEDFYQITNLNAVVALLITKALGRTAIASLLHLDLAGLSGAASRALAISKTITKQTGEAAVHEVAAAAKEAAENARERTKIIVGSLKDDFKHFGD
ncbi:MAG: hypothetical protein COV74_01210 [Candidatus Omnitrophica bacterium CG11_big_fil_rev_8_21_14_0_20_45_26]|uniref:AsmA domain-containing protein n=1 Tax=Candidatus Abzuiibacterium crystallinum TaxID=1974748 RepID=A0A2H0LSJ7_9BACT|nr:MAG: hypothetical protein COV74_01210 [Candidatus Omnitrophica bacterium CG11_big_fil_rev_8_21_14_0_20_45_26]PIW63484.1 MAG: hypothetical protein COW12_10245 [Candidatus Omnitrophica bacterium CG12_big_fil_rev_8_21_14_0_65_45_16]